MKSEQRSGIHKKSRTAVDNDNASPLLIRLIKSAAFATVITVPAAFILMLTMAGLSFISDDPGSLSKPVGLIILFVSAAICGFIGAKKCKEGAFLTGITSGAFFTLFIMLIATFLQKSDSLTSGMRAVFYLLLLPTAVLGSLISDVEIPKKRKTTVKRR